MRITTTGHDSEWIEQQGHGLNAWRSILGHFIRGTWCSSPFFSARLQRFTRSYELLPCSLFSPPSFSGGFLTLYILFQSILALHLLIMQVTTRVSVPSVTFPNLQWVTATKTALFRGHFLINATRMLVVGIQCGGDSFSLNCSYTMLPWLSYSTCPFSWDTLGSCHWWWVVLPY